jgi:pimeloyl-ACP methyl ester carboxylesterase
MLRSVTLRRALLGTAAGGAALLALGALATARIAARAQARFPSAGSFVRVEGLELHHTRGGAGPAVVLLHGAFGGAQDFEATIAPALRARAEVVAFDRPGSGWSERPADGSADPAAQARLLRAAARELGLQRPLLVGCSFGGAVALAWALQAPDEVAGVVTVGGALEPWPGDTAFAFRLAGVPLVGPLFAHTLAAPLGAWLAPASVERAFAPAAVSASFARSPFELGLRPASFLAQAEDLRGLNRFLADQAQLYGRLDVPVVLLHGAGDRVADAELHSAAAARALPRGEYRPVPGGGHQLLHSHPHLVLEAVEALLAAPARTRRSAGGPPCPPPARSPSPSSPRSRPPSRAS